MTLRYQHLVLVLFLWLPHQPVSGQGVPSEAGLPTRRAPEYVIDTWTTEEGLPQNTITAIAQTPDGYLWLGTLGGLVRFDGVQFVVFDRENTPGLESNRILALCNDRHGQLWIGTEGGGLSRFDGRHFTHFTPADGLPAHTVLALVEDPHGQLWIGTEGGGLARFEEGRFVRFTRQDGLGGDTVRTLYADRQGHLWIGTEGGGLTRFDGQHFTPFTPADGLPANTVLALVEDLNGQLWIGTEGGGLFQFAAGKPAAFKGWNGAPRERMRYASALVVDRKEHLWIATFKGLIRYREGTADVYTTREGLSRDNVRVLYEDREGSLWVGTDRGLNRFKEAIFSVYTEAAGLADDAALAVYEDREGTLWIGTNCGGLSRLKNGIFTTYGAGDGLSNPCVWSLTEDRDGALWIGTRGGLNRFKNNAFTAYTTAEGLADDFVLALYEDRDGALWIGTKNGLSQLKNGRFTTFTTQDGLAHNGVRSLLQDRSGGLWVATAGGLSRLEDGTFRNYTTRDGLSSDDVRALYEDEEGVLWIGTYDGGLNRLQDGRFTTYTTRDGLADNRISVILEDARGNLWMGGNRGIQRVGRRALQALAEGQSDRVAATLYGRGDGLKNPECNGGFQPAGWRSQAGRLWFPTVEGVAVVDPAGLSGDGAPPPVLIEQVLADEEPVAAGQRVALPRGPRNVEVRYTSTSLLSPERIRFRFKLEGWDSEWVEAGARRKAYYRNVAPGAYTFRVLASYDGAVWSQQEASLALYVPPYFYETRWFLALCALGLLAVLIVAYRLHTRRLEARAEELQHLVAERTGALQGAKERAEAALQETEQQREVARNALATIEEQALQLLRMDHLKSRFFANISHEFRTSLTLVMDPLESAVRGVFGPVEEDFKRQFQTALRNARRLLRLINQLLDLARLEAGSMGLHARQEDVVPFLRSLVEVFRSEAERLQITLLFSAAQEGLLLYFDPDKLEKIVFNLLSNALKATPVGGKVLVSVRQVDPGEAEAGYAEVTVRDTGMGIPPEKLPYIFDRFYQAEGPSMRQYAGAGIGLSLARELAQLHWGQIAVESVPGFGSVFTVRLPLGRDHLAGHEIIEEPPGPFTLNETYVHDVLASEPRPAPAGEAGAGASAPGEEGPPLVLVVEDNAEVREVIRHHLATAYRVAEAQNGLEGVQQARIRHPDLIISDVIMPGMEGIAFCRLLKQDRELSDIPVILLTARASEESRMEGLQVGADDYLTKPFSAEELLVRAGNLIRTRRALRNRFSQEVVLQPSGVVFHSAEAALLERVRDAVERHLEDPAFTVGMLASEAGLSEAQLKRKLRVLVDQAPVEFIRNLRLERAAQLLQQRAGNVSEVAFATGFNNLSYFARCFRERFGIVPSQYLADQIRMADGQAAPVDVDPEAGTSL